MSSGGEMFELFRDCLLDERENHRRRAKEQEEETFSGAVKLTFRRNNFKPLLHATRFIHDR